jgi:threonine synthase
MLGVQAAGAAPLVSGEPVLEPETVATAIRIGNPASWHQAVAAKEESGGEFRAATDEKILEAYRLIAAREGVFVEPASASSVAGLLAAHAEGKIDKGQRIVCTVTGHGLKDPTTALSEMPEPTPIDVDTNAVAEALDLA